MRRVDREKSSAKTVAEHLQELTSEMPSDTQGEILHLIHRFGEISYEVGFQRGIESVLEEDDDAIPPYHIVTEFGMHPDIRKISGPRWERGSGIIQYKYGEKEIDIMYWYGTYGELVRVEIRERGKAAISMQFHPDIQECMEQLMSLILES